MRRELRPMLEVAPCPCAALSRSLRAGDGPALVVLRAGDGPALVVVPPRVMPGHGGILGPPAYWDEPGHTGRPESQSFFMSAGSRGPG